MKEAEIQQQAQNPPADEPHLRRSSRKRKAAPEAAAGAAPKAGERNEAQAPLPAHPALPQQDEQPQVPQQAQPQPPQEGLDVQAGPSHAATGKKRCILQVETLFFLHLCIPFPLW